ncbi:hypothetical protein C8R45DRAFT_946968 [Mycena sanguinolenta]|nr:hypothetical protein C8R45DRAFT_946968 [Mycena sanguinolenta]
MGGTQYRFSPHEKSTWRKGGDYAYMVFVQLAAKIRPTQPAHTALACQPTPGFPLHCLIQLLDVHGFSLHIDILVPPGAVVIARHEVEHWSIDAEAQMWERHRGRHATAEEVAGKITRVELHRRRCHHARGRRPRRRSRIDACTSTIARRASHPRRTTDYLCIPTDLSAPFTRARTNRRQHRTAAPGLRKFSQSESEAGQRRVHPRVRSIDFVFTSLFCFVSFPFPTEEDVFVLDFNCDGSGASQCARRRKETRLHAFAFEFEVSTKRLDANGIMQG